MASNADNAVPKPVESLPEDTMGDSVQGESTTKMEENNVKEATATESSSGEVVSETAGAEGGMIHAQESDQSAAEPVEEVEFKAIYNKQKYDITFPLDSTISKLKAHIQDLTGVPASMQKIMFRGLARDEQTLRELKITKGAKLMVVGSTLTDVLAVTSPVPADSKEGDKSTPSSSKEPWCLQKVHKKVLDKYGKPDDAMVGVKGKREVLPPVPLTGMYNKLGSKVRLTFKLEVDQLWIGTKERTDKISMNSIKAVVSEPLKDHEEYHMMALQLGPTEASRYWIYWVPAQYVEAIKDAILGKWQY